MSLLSGDTVPYIEVTKDSVTYRLPVQQQGSEKSGYRPVPVTRSPKLSLPPPIAIAGPEGGQFRRNYDIDEMILIDWARGMGVDIYPPNAPPGGYAYGDLDSRAANYLTVPPLTTPDSDIAVGADNPGWRITELDYAATRLLLWNPVPLVTYRYVVSLGDWAAVADSTASNLKLRQVALGLNGVWGAGLNAAGAKRVVRSWDGASWDTMDLTPFTTPLGIAIFDNRVWVLDAVTSGSPSRVTWTVYSSADVVSAAAGGGTWATGNNFIGPATEQAVKLFTWMYPLERGKETLWCLTTSRLLYYDYYAATPTWQTWHVLRSPQLTGMYAYEDAHVWSKNGNLYTSSLRDDFLMEFTGNTISTLRINRGGGLPADRRLAALSLGSDGEFLYAFCALHSSGLAGSSGTGGVLAMAEGGSFHPLARPATAGQSVGGGGVGSDHLFPVYLLGSSNIRPLFVDNPELAYAPHLTTQRSYDPSAWSAVTGWLHGNLLNVNKRLLYFEADALKTSDGTPGLDTGCTIQIEYRRRGGSFVSAGTLTASDTFPAVLAISGGYTFKELQLRLTLDRGSTATQAPVLKALKVGFRPRPKQRYSYTARIDLRDGSPAFSTDDEKFWGLSASKLREILDELSDNDDSGLDDTLVALAYGGHGNLLHPRRRSASQCEVVIQAQESSDGGDGLYLLMFNDVSAPSSG
jgi:hypothetical protein